ncbi:MAG: hypothetical protein ACRDE2_00695, partial [Chitinophagaceae bacterium]
MDESRVWLLIAKKISNEATLQELAELEDLFKANPDLQYAFSIINEIKGQTAEGYDLTEEEENRLVQKRLTQIEMILNIEREKERSKVRKIRLRRLEWAAAFLLVIVALSLTYYFNNRVNHSQAIAQLTPKIE